jgi:hypothetical protein
MLDAKREAEAKGGTVGVDVELLNIVKVNVKAAEEIAHAAIDPEFRFGTLIAELESHV